MQGLESESDQNTVRLHGRVLLLYKEPQLSGPVCRQSLSHLESATARPSSLPKPKDLSCLLVPCFRGRRWLGGAAQRTQAGTQQGKAGGIQLILKSVARLATDLPIAN